MAEVTSTWWALVKPRSKTRSWQGSGQLAGGGCGAGQGNSWCVEEPPRPGMDHPCEGPAGVRSTGKQTGQMGDRNPESRTPWVRPVPLPSTCCLQIRPYTRCSMRLGLALLTAVSRTTGLAAAFHTLPKGSTREKWKGERREVGDSSGQQRPLPLASCLRPPRAPPGPALPMECQV